MTQHKRQLCHRGRKVSHAEFSRLWCDPSITAEDIAERLNISVQAVRMRAISRSLPKRAGGGGMNRKLDPGLFRAMWDANVGAREIAAYFGLAHPNSVSKRAREWGYPKRNCSKWSAISVLTFFMAKTARTEQAAMISAEMVDKRRDNRLVGAEHARGVM